MIRIGVLGTGSTHVDAFVRHLNREQHFPGLAVTTVLSDSPERDAELAALGLTVLPQVADVVAASDAILVTHREGGRHRALAEPGLLAGLPTFVDKPLATRHADARRLLELAEQHGTTVGSCSVLRLLPQVLGAGGHRPDQVTVRGPADPDSPHDGLFFYGIHSAEAACAVALAGVEHPVLPQDVRTERTDAGVVVEAELDGRRLRLELGPDVPSFSMDTGHGAEEIVLGEDYLAAVTVVIAGVVQDGTAPDPAPTLAAISLLEQAERLLASQSR